MENSCLFICRETEEICRQKNSNEGGTLILFYSWHGDSEALDISACTKDLKKNPPWDKHVEPLSKKISRDIAKESVCGWLKIILQRWTTVGKGTPSIINNDILSDEGPFLLQIAFSSHSATGEKERVSGNHNPECLFSDWISPYLLFLYWSPKALGFTEMHKVEAMINVSQTRALMVRMPAFSQRCHCSCRRLCLSLSHPSRGFPKQSVYVLSATLHGLQGLMGCEREPGVFHLVFSCTNTLHLPLLLRV